VGIRAGLGPRLSGGIREKSEIGLGASVVGEGRRKGLDWVGKKGEERRRRNSRREGERESKVEDEQEREIFFSFLVVANLVWVPPSSPAGGSWVYVFSVLLIRTPTYYHDFFLYVCMYL